MHACVKKMMSYFPFQSITAIIYYFPLILQALTIFVFCMFSGVWAYGHTANAVAFQFCEKCTLMKNSYMSYDNLIVGIIFLGLLLTENTTDTPIIAIFCVQVNMLRIIKCIY